MTLSIDEIQAQLDKEALGPANELSAGEEEKADGGRLRLRKTVPAPVPKPPPVVALPAQVQRSSPASSPQKSGGCGYLVLLVILCAGSYFGWRYYSHTAEEAEEARVAAQEAGVTVNGASRPKASATVMPCPLCRGVGHFQIPNTKLAKSVYECPVCLGKGSRSPDLSGGKTVCPTCSGMGRIGKLDDFFQTNQRYTSDPCTNCRGKGCL